MEETERFDTVIVGAGQAGLAAGYHLARRGRAFVILDAGERVGDSWRKRWDSLRLFTPARYDCLPGWAFPARSWSYPTKDDVADYFAAYVARFELPVRTGVRVDRLSRENGAFVVVSGDRRFEADNVVVATGAYQSPRIPTFARALDPGIVQLHSSEYRRPSQLQEGDTLVVGAGNSGAEIALEASREHRVLLSGRDTGQEPARAGSRADRLFTPAVLVPPHAPADREDADGPEGRETSFAPEASRSPASGERISPPPESNACRGLRVCRTECRCSTTVASSRSRTWSGAPGSSRTLRGSTCRSSTRKGRRCTTAGW